MKETLSAYLNFLKFPRLLKLRKDKEQLKKDLLWLLVLDLLFAGLIISIYTVLLKFKLIREYEDQDPFKMLGPFWAMVFIVIVAPVLEEYVFRFQLRRYRLSLLFVFISLAVLLSSFTNNDFVKLSIYIGFLITGILVFIIQDKISVRKGYLIWRKYYVFLFYYTALIFGYVHITNIKELKVSDPSFLIYVLSQAFGGMSMGYIRIKYGLKYSILLHACFNLIVGGGYLLYSLL